MPLCRQAIRLYKDQSLSLRLTSSLLPKLSGVKSSRKSQRGMIHLSGVKSTERNFLSVLMNKSVSPDTLVGEQQGWRKELRSPGGAAGCDSPALKSKVDALAKQFPVLASPKVSFPPPYWHLHNSLVLESTRGPALNLGERWWSSSNPSSTPDRSSKAEWDPL